MQLLASDVITAAGDSKDSLWSALTAGRDCSVAVRDTRWGHELPLDGRVCLISDKGAFGQRYAGYFSKIWSRVRQTLSPKDLAAFERSRVGVIFSSTKGLHEDYIRQAHFEINQDPYAPILSEFVEKNLGKGLIARSLCISHACASTHVSLEQADFWLKNNICDYVVLLAGDLLGPFVVQGFQSLKILSATKSRPFAADRDGLQLGEACAILLLSRKTSNQNLFISSVQTESEGVSVVRPSAGAAGLGRAVKKLTSDLASIDFIVAHGTATKFNDLSEDQVFAELPSRPFVSGCKWSIGHTLGASGAVDIIAAQMLIERQQTFHLGNSLAPDPELRANYLYSGRSFEIRPVKKVLISSLGFGGINGALILQKGTIS